MLRLWLWQKWEMYWLEAEPSEGTVISLLRFGLSGTLSLRYSHAH